MRRIIGYGSLVSEDSARGTCPNLKDFQLGYIKGYRRIFDLVASHSITNHGVDPSEKTLASCYAAPHKTAPNMLISSFEISNEKFVPLLSRECEYYAEQTTIYSIDGRPNGTGDIFVGFGNDEAMYAAKGKDVIQRLWPAYWQKYKGPYYGADKLPCPIYLKKCLVPYSNIGQEALNNFIDTSALANETPLRQYLKDINYEF